MEDKTALNPFIRCWKGL